MEFVFDMGDHAIYVWPSYAAFAVIVAGLFLWIGRANAKARARLEALEKDRT